MNEPDSPPQPPRPDRSVEERLRSEDFGLTPAQRATLADRDELFRALTTACRLAWSPEPWAAAQGRELCRALAETEPLAAEILFLPLAPRPGRDAVTWTDGPWIPLELLARLTTEAVARGVDPWAETKTAIDLQVNDTEASAIPPLPPALRRLEIANAPALKAVAGSGTPRLEGLSLVGAPDVEPWVSTTIDRHRGWVRQLDLDRSGEELITAGVDGTIHLSHLSPEPRPLATLEGHARPVEELAWRPRGRGFASASRDGTVRVWEDGAGGWRERGKLGHEAEVSGLAWSPDGTRLVSIADDPIVRIWSVEREGWSAEELAGHGGPVQNAAWSPDGLHLVTVAGDATARLWSDGGSGFGEGETIIAHDDWVRTVAWHPRGEWVATGSDDGTVRWVAIALKKGAFLRRKGAAKIDESVAGIGATGWIRQVAFDASGGWLAAVSDDGGVRGYAIGDESSEEERQPQWCAEHPVRVTAFAWHPRAPIFATGDDDGILRVFRVRPSEGGSASRLLSLDCVEGHAHFEAIGRLRWHPTEPRLFSGSDDRTARAWEPAETWLGSAWRSILTDSAGSGP